MQKPATKANILLALETLIRQAVWEYKERGFGELNLGTTDSAVEAQGPVAVRVHAIYNERVAMKIMIEKWSLQSDDFLKPELVGGDSINE